MTRRLVVVFALLLAGLTVHTQEAGLPDDVRRAADGITAEQLGRDLAFLASDELLGRNTPSPGFDMAADYIVKRLEKAGVTPAGDRGTFLQRYVMRESQVTTAEAYVEFGALKFRFGDDFVLRSFAAPLEGPRPVVYVGHGWTVPAKGIDP